MSTLSLDVRLDGYDHPIGTLERLESRAIRFTYAPLHLEEVDPLPLSLSLPVREEPYDDVLTRAFFDNLLQERDSGLSRILAREGLARDDIVAILSFVGKDCPGALSVLPQGAPAVKVPGDLSADYVALSDERLKDIVSALHERRDLPDGVDDPSPLAGVQSKIALTVLPDGRFALPREGSGAPTTHILKTPTRRSPKEALLEEATLSLSRDAGFDTARAEVVRIGAIDTLLVERFDRDLNAQGLVVRRHQEDFAQALGLPASLKYQRDGRVGRRFDTGAIASILDRTLDPAQSRLTFIRSTVFDLLTGNVDAHAKNHALFLFGANRASLTPRYDLTPTRLNPNLTEQLPFDIGAAQKLEAITQADLANFLSVLGIKNAAAQRRLLSDQIPAIANNLCEALPDLDKKRMKPFGDLIAQNIRQLFEVVGLTAPEAAQTRDAFVAKGGGWASS